MTAGQDGPRPVTRRGVLVGAAAAGLTSTVTLPRPSLATEWPDDDPLFAALDQKIMEGMERYSIPGAAVGVIWRGQSYMRGYGVTDVSNPQQQVNTDTLFKTGSIAKTFTGTVAERLVDQGRLVLDQRVDSYVEDFVAPAGAQSVTVRQLLNHTPGWDGDDLHDTGSDNGALARYVNDIRNLPQLTPVGEVFAYNNAALCCAGRVIETVTGLTYETAVEQLVFQPLGMSRTGFAATPDGLDNLALPHIIGSDGKAVVDPAAFYFPRNINPAGAQEVTSVKDLLTYAQFHLGDGRAADGQRVMSLAALRGMWSMPGPGGTLEVELIGMGVSWELRPTAEGVVVVQHSGDITGYRPHLMLVPAQQFAIVLLNNSDGGIPLRSELFTKGWLLRHFVGLHNLPAPPRQLSASELAQYEGHYAEQAILTDNQVVSVEFQLTGRPDGTLQQTHLSSGAAPPPPPAILTFYANDYVINESSGLRYNFLRDESGAVVWMRFDGRLYGRSS
ncbi:MAG: beta-lactamase family protein [Acetobacteraceae bacterium]|nr:beta-lactamase family protein [Acetobacteraceae bacterium]